MDSNIKGCLFDNIRFNIVKPLLVTSFVVEDGYINFTQAKNDINGCNKLTEIQKEHFGKYLDYLSNWCNGDDKLVQYHGIDIISSKIFNEPKYYVKISNAVYQKKSNQLIIPKTLCIAYRPEIFVKNQIWQNISYIASYLPIYFCYTDKSKKSKAIIRFGYKNVAKPNYINSINQFMTWLNCFTYAGLSFINRVQELSMITNYPFTTSFKIIVRGLFYSFVGESISNLSPYYSNILFNGILLFVNYRLWLSIRK